MTGVYPRFFFDIDLDCDLPDGRGTGISLLSSTTHSLESPTPRVRITTKYCSHCCHCTHCRCSYLDHSNALALLTDILSGLSGPSVRRVAEIASFVFPPAALISGIPIFSIVIRYVSVRVCVCVCVGLPACLPACLSACLSVSLSLRDRCDRLRSTG